MDMDVLFEMGSGFAFPTLLTAVIAYLCLLYTSDAADEILRV